MKNFTWNPMRYETETATGSPRWLLSCNVPDLYKHLQGLLRDVTLHNYVLHATSMVRFYWTPFYIRTLMNIRCVIYYVPLNKYIRYYIVSAHA